MHMEQSGAGSQPSGDQEERSQGLGGINDMLRGTVAGVGDNLRNIVRGEVELAKTELKEEAGQVGRAGGMIAGGGVLGFTGFVFLMLGVTHLLSKKLPMWVSASIVGTALVTAAGILGTTGKSQLQSARLEPEQTIESLRETKEAASREASSLTDHLTPGSD